MNSINKCVSCMHNHDLGLLFTRLAIGIVFIVAGWMKVSNLESVIGFFGSLGIPTFFAYLVSYVEFLGGIAFILGIFVRYFGILTAIIMIVALSKVHLPSGYSLANGGYEEVLILFFLSLAMVTMGAGSYSLTRLFKK